MRARAKNMPKFSKLPEKEDHMDTPIMDEVKVEYPDFLPVLFTEILTNLTARRTPIDLAMVFMRDIDKAPGNDCDITPFTNMGSYRHGQRVAHLGTFTLYLGVSPTGEGLILLHDKNGQVASSNTASHLTQFTALLGAGCQHGLDDYAQATIKGE